jgi:hypothetical protein
MLFINEFAIFNLSKVQKFNLFLKINKSQGSTNWLIPPPPSGQSFGKRVGQEGFIMAYMG